MSSLTVHLESPSWFLASKARFEVRNGDYGLIETLPAGGSVDLDPGLYHVSAVLQDGRNHVRLVQVQEESVTLSFDMGEKNAPTTGSSPHTQPDPPVIRPRSPIGPSSRLYRQPLESLTTGNFSTDGAASVTLLSSEGATARQVSDQQWIFEPDDGKTRIPKAHFQTQTHRFDISLPTNPMGHFPENACTVQFGETGGNPGPKCWIAPERQVANAMQHWLVNGRIAAEVDTLSEATHLLQGKYSDPTGALLGGLILLRLGQLADRESWINNLARDFQWLTDGQVLQLVLQAEAAGCDMDLLARAADLSARPVLFTETYSILVNLLRRWPGASRADYDSEFSQRRTDVLRKLAERTVHVDWSSVALTIARGLDDDEQE